MALMVGICRINFFGFGLRLGLGWDGRRFG